jgi:aspartate/methionine/tyrosine aminotransferase
VFANITGTGFKSAALQDRLLNEAGVATVAGTSFGRFGEGYIRFSYANSTDNIRRAIRRIREHL